MATNVATLTVILRGDNRALNTALREAERGISATGRSMSSSLTRTGQIMTASITAPFIAASAFATRTAVQWESAFAGVRKTITASEEEFAALDSQLRELASSPDSYVSGLQNAHTEIARIAELAGQLGVPIDDVANFTEVIAELTMTTNLTADSASLMLAQFANITKLDFSEFRAIGDIIVNLGNNMATTEADIVHFMQRIAGATHLVGFSQGEIAALAATLASTGLRAESAGTSMSQLLLNIDAAVAGLNTGVVSSDSLIANRSALAASLLEEQAALTMDVAAAQERYNALRDQGGPGATAALDNLNRLQERLAEVNADIQANNAALGTLQPGQMVAWEDAGDKLQEFARIASLALDEGSFTASEFAELWKTDVSDALTQFVIGLGKMESGEQIAALEALGLSGVRLSDMLRRLAGNSELLKEAWDTMANSENALAIEAAKRFATTEAQFNRFKNTVYDLGIVVGSILLPPLNSLLTAASNLISRFANLDEGVMRSALAFGAILASVGPLLLLITKLSGVFAAIAALPLGVTLTVVGLAIWGIVKALKGMTGSEGVVGFLSTFISWLQRTFNFSEYLMIALQQLVSFLGRFGDIARKVGTWLSRVWNTVGTAFGFVNDTVEEVGTTFERKLANGIFKFNAKLVPVIEKVREFTDLILALATVAVSAFTGVDLGEVISSMFDVRGIENSPLFKLLFGEETKFADVQAKIENIADKIKTALQTALTFTSDIWNSLKTSFQNFVDTFVTEEGLDVKKLVGAIGEKIQNAINAIKEFDFQTFVNNLETSIKTYFDNVSWDETVLTLVNSLVQKFKDINWEALKSIIATKINLAFNWVAANVQNLITAIPVLVEKIMQFLRQEFEKAKTTEIGQSISSKIETIFTDIQNIDTDQVVTDLKTKLDNIGNSLTEFSTRLEKEGIVKGIVDQFEEITGFEVSPEVTVGLETFLITITGLLGANITGNLVTELLKLKKSLGGKAGKSFIGGLTKLFGLFKGKLAGAAGVTIIASTIGALANKLPALGAALVDFFNNAKEGNWSGVLKLVGILAATLDALAVSIGEFIAQGIIDVLPTIGDLLADFANVFGALGDLLAGDKSFADSLKEIGAGIGSFFVDLSEGFLALNITAIESVINLILTLLELFGADEALGLDTDSIRAQAAELGNNLKIILSTVTDMLKEELDVMMFNIGTFIKEIGVEFQKMWDSVVPGDQSEGLSEKEAEVTARKGAVVVRSEVFDFKNTGTVGPALQLLFEDGLASIKQNGITVGTTVPLDVEKFEILNTEEVQELLRQAEQAFITQSTSEVPLDPTITMTPTFTIPDPAAHASNLLAAQEAALNVCPVDILPIEENLDPSIADPAAYVGLMQDIQQAAIANEVFNLNATARMNIDVIGVNLNIPPQSLTALMRPTENQTGGRVLATGLHVLHKDEEVLTRQEAAAYRRGGGGGGNTVIIQGMKDVDSIINELARRGIYL